MPAKRAQVVHRAVVEKCVVSVVARVSIADDLAAGIDGVGVTANPAKSAQVVQRAVVEKCAAPGVLVGPADYVAAVVDATTIALKRSRTQILRYAPAVPEGVPHAAAQIGSADHLPTGVDGAPQAPRPAKRAQVVHLTRAV